MYKIRFEDDSEFIGGEPVDSKWDLLCRDKKIAVLQYDLMGVSMILKGFEAYNHIVEHAKIIDPKKRSQSQIIARVIVMGKWKENVYCASYDLLDKMVCREITTYGKEYQSKPIYIDGHKIGDNYRCEHVTGWVNGVFDPKVFPKLKQG